MHVAWNEEMKVTCALQSKRKRKEKKTKASKQTKTIDPMIQSFCRGNRLFMIFMMASTLLSTKAGSFSSSFALTFAQNFDNEQESV